MFFLPAHFSRGRFSVFVLVPQEHNFELMLVILKYIILEIARDLKIVFFPSSDNCHMRQRFITLCFLSWHKNFFSLEGFLYVICTPNTLIHSLVRSKHFIQQSATLTLFRTPIPAISH